MSKVPPLHTAGDAVRNTAWISNLDFQAVFLASGRCFAAEMGKVPHLHAAGK